MSNGTDGRATIPRPIVLILVVVSVLIAGLAGAAVAQQAGLSDDVNASLEEIEDTDIDFTIERTIEDDLVAPGETTEVTVTIETEEPVDGAGMAEQFEPALDDIEIVEENPDTFVAGPDDANEELVATWDTESDAFELTYEITVPETAEIGETVEIDGEGGPEEVDRKTPEGDTSVTIGLTDDSQFDVSIVEVTDELVAGEELQATAEIENLGLPDDQEIELVVRGVTRDTEQVSLETGETTTVELTHETSDRDAPAVEAIVESEDDFDSADVSVQRPAEFDVSIIDTNDPVPVDETLEATVSVENIGDLSTEQTVWFNFRGETVDEEEVSLDPGETETISLSVQVTEEDIGTRSIEAESEDDVSVRRVNIGESADFIVAIDEPESVVAGETAGIDVAIENEGTRSDEQWIALESEGDSIAGDSVALDGGDTTTIGFEIQTDSSDIGTIPLSVSSEDDTGVADLEVLAPASLKIDIATVTDPVTRGDEVEVEVDVSNDGEVEATETVELFVDDTVVDEATVTVDGGETSTATLTADTGDDDGDTMDLTVQVTDAIDQTAVEIQDEGAIVPTIQDTTDPVTIGETLGIQVLVTNEGDITTSEGLTVELDGEPLEEREVTLDGGESDRVIFETAIDEDREPGETTIEVETESGTDTETVEIVEPPEDAFFRLSSPDMPDDMWSDEAETVTTQVQNVGELEDTQDVFLRIGDEILTSESVTLAGGEEETISATLSDLSEGVYEVTAESADQERSSSLTVVEPEPATIEILEASADEEVTAGGEVAIEVTLRNVGDRAGETTLEAVYEDQSTTASVSVEAEEEVTETVSVAVPKEPRAGVTDREIVVSTDVDEAGVPLTVDFGTIQSGIDEAEAGGTIVVEPGTYQESLYITTLGITIDAPDGAVLEPDSSTGIDIGASDVSIAGIDIGSDEVTTGVRISESDVILDDIRIEGAITGVEVVDGDSQDLQGIRAIDTEIGILLDGSGNVDVAYSRITETETGVLVESPDVVIRSTRITSSDRAILLDGDADNTLITNNEVRDNEIGLLVRAGDGHVIDETNLEANDVSILSELEDTGGIEGAATSPTEQAPIDADNNWWGSPDGPDEVDIIDRGDDTVSAEGALESRLEGATFGISVTDIPEEAVQGQTFELTVEVENTGDLEDRQDVELVVGDTVVDRVRGVNVTGSESTTVTLSYAPDEADEKEIELIVRTDDDSDTASVEVTVEPLAEYADEDGFVSGQGVLQAFGDWQAGEIDAQLFLDAFNAWTTGEPVI